MQKNVVSRCFAESAILLPDESSRYFRFRSLCIPAVTWPTKLSSNIVLGTSSLAGLLASHLYLKLFVRSLPDKTLLFESKRRRLPAVGTSFMTCFCFLGTRMYAFGFLQLLGGNSAAHGKTQLLRYTELLWSVTSSEMYMLRKGCANNKIDIPLSCNMKRLMLWVIKFISLNKPVLERDGKRKWRNALFPGLTKHDVCVEEVHKQ